MEFPGNSSKLMEQYPVTAHAPNFHFRTGYREIKRCEESKRTLKNPFASRLAEFNTTLKLLRITDQWYIVPVKFRFGRNRNFLALLLLPLAGGSKGGKRFDAVWRLISSASFHPSHSEPNAVLANKIIRCIFLCSCVFMSRFGRGLNPIRDG